VNEPNFDVLDHNLGRLLRESYQRVEAAPKFRERVRREFLGRVVDLAHERAENSRSPAARTRSTTQRWALMAASLLGLLFGVRAWMRSGAETRDEILARGAVAVRRMAPGVDGRAVEARGDSAQLELEPGRYEVATPADLPAEYAIDSASASESGLIVFPGSSFTLVAGGERPEVSLELGGMVVRRSAESGPSWLIQSRQGQLFVPAGVFDVRVAIEAPDDVERWPACAWPADEWMHVSVRRGVVEPSTRLPESGEGYLCDGEWMAPSDAAAESAPSRTSVDSVDGAATPSPSQGYRRVLVHGRVFADGAPLKKFEIVSLESLNLPRVADPRSFAFESENGEFELVVAEDRAPDLTPGVHTLYAKAEGFPPARTEVEVSGEIAAPVIETRFDLAAGARLEGLVIDARTGRPIEGAYVVSETDSQLSALALNPAENRDFASATFTRLEGDFVLAPLSPGTHSIRASAPGFGAAWSEMRELRAGEARAGLRFELKPAGSIVGIVLDDDRRPIVGATLLASTTDFERKRPSVSYARSVTDAEGRYAITDLSEGSWALLNFGTAPGSLAPDFRFAQVRAGGESRVDFKPGVDSHQLVGRVFERNGEPVVGRSLMVGALGGVDAPQNARWVTATTGSDGSYRATGVEPGEQALYLSGRTPAEMMWVGTAKVEDAARTEQDVLLDGVALRGTIFDGEKASPMPFGVVIVLRDTPFGKRFQGRVFTREDGSFELNYVEPGSYDVFAYSTRGGFGQEQRIGVAVDGSRAVTGLDFSLFPGGSLAVSLSDADGKPVRGTVKCFDSNGVHVQFSDSEDTGPNGRYVISGVKPGVWEVRAIADGFDSASQSTTVRAGERSAIDFVLRRP